LLLPHKRRPISVAAATWADASYLLDFIKSVTPTAHHIYSIISIKPGI
jgi:hypothetical protein